MTPSPEPPVRPANGLRSALRRQAGSSSGLIDPSRIFRRPRFSEERPHWTVWLRLAPRCKTLRGDPRFAELAGRLKDPV